MEKLRTIHPLSRHGKGAATSNERMPPKVSKGRLSVPTPALLPGGPWRFAGTARQLGTPPRRLQQRSSEIEHEYESKPAVRVYKTIVSGH